MRSPSQGLPVPRSLAGGGIRAGIAVGLAGAVLGSVALAIPAFLTEDAAFGLLAILLGMIAAVYLGFALQDGRMRVFGLEYVGMLIFAALAVVALALENAVILAAGYFGHGLWDAIHHRRGLDTAMPPWYVPLCLGFDAVVGIYVLARFA